MSQMDPRFAMAVMTAISNPPLMCDVAGNIFFPEAAKDLQNWTRLQVNANYGDAYDKFRQHFPSAPERTLEDQPDFLFREMLKHIIAKAFDLQYITVRSIQIAH